MSTLMSATKVPAARIIPTNDQHDALKNALRNAAGWLQSAGDTCGLQSLKDAAARAQAALAEVANMTPVKSGNAPSWPVSWSVVAPKADEGKDIVFCYTDDEELARDRYQAYRRARWNVVLRRIQTRPAMAARVGS